MRLLRYLPLLAAPLFVSPAHAGDVVFTGALVNSCVLNVTTPGVLGAATDGTTLSSETGTGVPAIMTVVAVGAAPTLNFTAPALTKPAAHTGGTQTVAVRYQSLSGATQAYTSSASSMTAGALVDTVTVNSRVTSTNGFVSGTYSVRSTVTCQQ